MTGLFDKRHFIVWVRLVVTRRLDRILEALLVAGMAQDVGLLDLSGRIGDSSRSLYVLPLLAFTRSLGWVGLILSDVTLWLVDLDLFAQVFDL